jgi:hypothetical protein
VIAWLLMMKGESEEGRNLISNFKYRRIVGIFEVLCHVVPNKVKACI